jgi:mono/diheme cytochrome c family protein
MGQVRRVRVVFGFLLAGVVLTFAVLKYFGSTQSAVETAESLPVEEDGPARGQRLYGQYCEQCHGEKGDGAGPAARFLYPKPRNFGEGKFRLVTTTNRMASDEDLLDVLRRGMPGSAMFPFAHLSEEDRKALVGQVRTLMRALYEERFRRMAAEQNEKVDAVELAREIDELVRPGPVLTFPDTWPPSSPEAIAHGREIYSKACNACHGNTGKGDGAQEQRNDDGTPTRPRDFGRGLFKSGRDLRQLFARVYLGMPGSPMPGSRDNVTPSGMVDLLHFVLSLSDPEAQTKGEHKRTQLLASRKPSPLPPILGDAEWSGVPAVRIVLSPLWWRDYAEPDLHVQAIHDGESLAIRLSWSDPTQNTQAVRPQEFEDMAALQLFKGEKEPFLGMGGANQDVDVWHWRAGASNGPASYPDVDTTYPHMSVDMYPFEKPGNDARQHAPERQPPEYITARAAGNVRSDPTAGFSGYSLQAKGFGSLTMRPRVSQLVDASGHWADGRWTVVLRRPVNVATDAGVPLTAGDKLSIAFAVWDGAARDRNGQKLVSIWHDLHLE